MSKSINKVILVGFVGNDPEGRILEGGRKAVNFPLATNRYWKDKHGRSCNDVSWHKCLVFDGLADIVESWVKKGGRLYVEGRIQYNTSEASDGKTTYWTNIVVTELVMLDSKQPKSKGKKREQFIPHELGDRNQEDLPF